MENGARAAVAAVVIAVVVMIMAVDSNGRRLGVFLPCGTVVRGGDVLVAEDGSFVVVKAAPQPSLVVCRSGTR